MQSRAERRAARRWVVPYVAALALAALPLGWWVHRDRHAEIARGAELWESRCGGCHSLLRTLAPRSASEWHLTVERMQQKPEGRLPDEDAAAIGRFLAEANILPAGYRRGWWVLRANRERWGELYERKCVRCHTTERIPRGREHAGWLYWSMERDRRRHPFWISVADQRQIFDYLHLGDLDSPLDYARARCTSCHGHRFALAFLLGLELPREEARLTDPRELVAKRCFECHTETILEECHDPAAWRSIVERMRDKAPAFIRPEDLEPIVRFLSAAPRCGERIAARAP